MAPPFNGKDGLLARVNFPLYSVQLLTSRHILVAGGGGSAKTGVANGFEIFEVSHNGKRFVAEEVVRHETGPTVVMNCAVKTSGNHTFLVAGQESHSQLYNVQTRIQNAHQADEEQSTTKRRRRTSETNGSITGELPQPAKRLTFGITPSDSVQTDFSPDEPLQKVVRISEDGRLMATGGTDGLVRLWQFPLMKLKIELVGHTKEVDDVDFNIGASQVVSVSKDGRAIVWSCTNGKGVADLRWPTPAGSKYVYRRCRFGAVEEVPSDSRLFLVSNPIGQAGKLLSYLQMWDPKDWNLKRSATCNESIATLAVRDDGRFVATGTMFSGSIHIYVAFSLQRVHVVQGAHRMFVTGLTFLPVNSPLAVASTAEAAVISISVDNRICMHTLRHRRSMPAWIAVALIIFTLFLTFLFCSFIGL